jgi:hypothetical protein
MEKEDKKRTLTQNNSIHKFCELLSEELDNAGLDIKRTLKEEFEIPWSPERVKELLWKPLQEAMLDKTSTTQLTTKEVSKVYEVLNRWLGTKHGLHVPWPSEEDQTNKKTNKKRRGNEPEKRNRIYP